MLRLPITCRQGARVSPVRHGPPGILAPWLVTGLGLAALVMLPETEVSDPALAADVRPLVVTGRASLAPAFADLATPRFTPRLTSNATGGVDGLLSIAHVDANSSLEVVTDASTLPKPAMLDRMFAVSGSPTRAFPEGFEHPLLTTTAQ